MAQSTKNSQPSTVNLLSAWDQAFVKFRKTLSSKELGKLSGILKQRQTYSDLLGEVGKARDLTKSKRWRFTDTVQSIFKTVNDYAIIGDIMVQHNPEYTALAWGAFRFVLMAAVQEGETSEKLVDSLDWIARILFRADEYTKLWAHEETAAQSVLRQLQDDLVALFTEVLIFLYQAMNFFKKYTLRRYISAAIKPFEKQFQGIYDRITHFEAAVGKDIGLLNAGSLKIQEQVENGKWLCHAEAEFSADFEKLGREHLRGTCKWFLETEKVEKWMDSGSNSDVDFLWVYGKPGCGKSTLATQLIHRLSASAAGSERDSASEVSQPIIRIFCKTGMANRNDVLSILRNIIYQLVESSTSDDMKRRLHSIIAAERVAAKTTVATSMQQLWSLLGRLLEPSNGCFCIIDGLDECSNTSEEIADFVDRLSSAFNASPSRTAKAAVLSRLPLPTDSQGLWQCHHIEDTDVDSDIELFAATKLEASPKLSKHPQRDRLLSTLIGESEGMILWTRLMLSELENNHWNVDAVLKKPPKGLHAVYSSIIERLQVSNDPYTSDKRRHALRLALAASRPLHRDEFVLAIATMEGLSDHDDYNLRSDPQAEFQEIIGAVAPLLTVLPNNTVQLVHASLKEFLLEGSVVRATTAISNPSTGDTLLFGPNELHGPITIALLSYLSFPCFKDEISKTATSNYPLLEYATCQLIWHVTKVEERSQAAECIELLIRFFHSTQGWRWLRRLDNAYDTSIGHQQVLHTQLKDWLGTMPVDTVPERDIFNNLLLRLSENGLEATTKAAAAAEYPDLEVNNTISIMMARLAELYAAHGQWNRVEILEAEVVETRKRVLGQEHPDTLKGMINLAGTFTFQGRLKEAEQLEVLVLEAQKRILGQDHPDTLISMANLASTYWCQSRWKEAEELEVLVLEAQKRILGQDHPDTLNSMANLASTYWDQSRWKEAEELEVLVLEARKRVLGQDHPDTLNSMANLAATYSSQGRWKEAEELKVLVLEARKRVLGQDHPDTLTSMSNLAVTYSSRGRWKEAEELKVLVLEARKRVLGQDHPDTLISMSNLAVTYSSQCRWKKAEELEVLVLEARKRVLGQDHTDTLTSMANLAATYSSQGRWKEADELKVLVLQARKRVLGQDHPDTLTSMANLAATYSSQSRWKEAEELKVLVLEARKRVLGQDHPNTLNSMANLAYSYKAQGRIDEGIKILAEVAALRSDQLGNDHPDTKASEETLIEWRGLAEGLRKDIS